MSEFDGQKGKPSGGGNPRIRSNIYAVAALYLLYLYYKTAVPYFTHDPYDAPSTAVFLLATVVLGGGGIVIAVIAWRLHRQSKEMEKEAAEEANQDSSEENGGADE